MDPKTENLQRAIGLMTAWAEGDDPMFGENAMLEARQVMAPTSDGRDPQMATLVGLQALCGILLIRLDTEVAPADTLREIALRYSALD